MIILINYFLYIFLLISSTYNLIIDMSTKQSKQAKKKLPWQSQNNSYEQNVRAIKLAQESFVKNTPISLESAFSEKQSRIIKKSIRISEMARNSEPLDYSQGGQSTNIAEFILNEFKLEDEKYAVFQNTSEHSSEEEAEVKVSNEEIEDIVVSVKKDPQNGKITFISKLINTKKIDVQFRVLKKRAIGNFIPQVHQIRTLGNFVLYEIQVNSFLKKIAVELVVEDKIIATSREISFSPRQILLDLELSYNLDQKYDIKINLLEGLLASCILEGDKFAQQILQLNGKRELKTKILSERYTVDEETRLLIRQNKNASSILKQLKLLIEEEKFIFGAPSQYASNPAYLSLVKIFMEEMLKFKPSVGREEREDITVGQAIKLVELFINFYCLIQLKAIKIQISSFEKEAHVKLDEFIHFVFQVPQMRIYHRFIQICIGQSLPILPQGYDTIKDYVTDYSLNSSEYILTTMENIFYTIHTKRVNANPVKLFLAAFQEKKFENTNIYEKQMPDILKLSKLLFQLIDIETLSFQNFISFFKAYWNFRQNNQLKGIVCQPILKEKIENYINSLKYRLQNASQKQKSLGITLVELYFITLKDDELMQNQQTFKKLVQYLIDRVNDQHNFDLVVKLYFEIFKRGNRIFSIEFVRNLSKSLSKNLLKQTPIKALTLLGKYFVEDYLESQELIDICNDYLLKDIITKLIPQTNIKKFLQDMRGKHSAWHNNFKYPNHFNQQILERMARIVQKHFGNDNINKQSYLNQIKMEINRQVEDEDRRSSLLAIIEYDMLKLEVENVWEYFTQKRGYLKILIKILKRGELSSETLKGSLMEIHRQMQTKNVNFQKIMRIKSMKPNEWNSFVHLTDNNAIPALVGRIYEEGNAYLNKLKKLENFIREIGVKFNSPNYEELCLKLQSLSAYYVKQSIGETNIQEQIPVFRGFKQEILTCYKLKPFFGTQKLNNKPIQQIIKACGDLLVKLQTKIAEVYQNYENGTIKSNSFYYFQPKKDDIKQFRNILLMNKKEEIPKNLEDIVIIYSIIADAQENYRLLFSFITLQSQKFNIQSPEIIQFAKLCSKFKSQESVPVKDIQEKLNQVHTKLKQNKLNYRQHKHFFEAVACLIQNASKIPFFYSIENDLKDIKDDINESGGDIEYEEIEDCQIAIQFLKEVYDIQATFSQFISSYFAYIQKKKQISKDFSISQILKTAFFIIPQLKQAKANMEDNNRSAVKFIDEVIKRVRFQFKNDEKNKDRVITITTIYPQEKARLIDERQIYMNKQKAIMISCTMKDGDSLQRKKQIDNFLKIIKVFEQLKEQELKLTEWGCRQFQEESIIIQISNCQLTGARQMIQKREVQLKQWKRQIKNLYQINFKATHLQGKKFKQFYDFILKPNVTQIPNHFLVILDNVEIHNIIIKQLAANSYISKIQSLSTIFSYFKLLSKCVKQELAADRDENFLHFLKMPKGQIDFISGIKQIGSARIQKLKFQQMLICTSETSRAQLKSFIQRALRDPDSQYIMIGFQNLDRRKQQYIVDQIKSYKAEYGSEGFKLKLCLIGDSELELLNKFASEQLNKSPEKSQTVETVAKAYENKLKQECKMIKIVYSSAAGLGKTRYIKNHSFNIYQCTEQYFLPLSGIMAVPVESIDQNNNSVIINQTEKFLWDRFEQAINYFSEAQKNKIKSCLVIKIYNVQVSVVDTINKFLQNVLFFKSHRYRNNNGKMPKNIPIYIELQNVSLPTYTKLNKGHASLPPQMRMLSFLREIKSVCGDKFTQNIESFSSKNIQYKPTDKQLNYILYHLKLLKSEEINKVQIPQYESYQMQPINEEEGIKLITDYFFQQFAFGERPSGYLWTYFRSLLFEASKNFSTSYFLKISSVAETDESLRVGNKALHQKMKLKQNFRSQFYKIIHKNCIQFIQRSVKPGNESSNNALNQTLKNLPFLIIPNIDGDSFSFIYNKSANVPEVIKAMIVLQSPKLLKRITTISIQNLFQEQNLAAYQKNPGNKQWVERASQILANISGNRHYQIDCEKGYVVNIDNFFKMCLIVQRMRLNIPIVIMGEAGIGKTALLRHVVHHLFKHEFAVYNINAGLPLESKKSNNKAKINESLADIVENIKELYQKVQAENAFLEQNDKKTKSKKLWVFFDEFNTLRQLGFFKEIIIDGRYLGKEQTHIKNVVMMAACNPHKKLQLKEQQKQQQFVKEQVQKLAFDVLPAPHSLIECMWNYGALTSYEYEKYISKMLVEVKYQSEKITSAILNIHKKIGELTYESAVSLRDIDRFRQLYKWFNNNLPRQLKVNLHPILGAYNNIEERAFILSCYFTYILRFDTFSRNEIEKQIEKTFNFKEIYLRIAKETEEDDLCSRLNFHWDAPIAVNDSLKENLYSCFVCINTRLPLLIIGAPGCSKSLSLRILAKNLKEKINDQYLSKFKRIRQYPIQGSENTTTQDIKIVFQKAYKDLFTKNGQLKKQEQIKEMSVVVFDEIGLAQKSKDNPLKVLHPYLQVSRQQNLEERMLSFIGISNSQLDVSKMSRLLVLRRPPAELKDLIYTAKSIASGYRYGDQQKIKYIIDILTRVYNKFIENWKLKDTNYQLFYGLRDFYGLIKIFMSKLIQNQIDIDNDEDILECAGESIFENFHGWQGTYKEFKLQFYDQFNYPHEVPQPTMKDTLESVLQTLDKQSFRYPLVIVDDHQSLCFVKWLIERRYPNKSVYMEGSPFVEEKEYSLKLLGQICKYMDHQCVLILSNLSEGVKTGLYDFFNKSFTVRASNNNKYLKIRTQEGSLNQVQYLYHQKFNCVYLLLEKHLQDVQPPFLSRFQKYRFSLTQYRRQLSVNVLLKVERFMLRVQQICKNNKMEHFKVNNLFINCKKAAMESLAVASFQTAGQDGAYKEALRRLIMNSGQYFFKIYKHYIEPNGDLPEIRDIMNDAIDSKNNGIGNRNLIIRFTNDKYYTKKFNDKTTISAQFVTFKKQADFDEELSKFFKSNSKRTLYICLNVTNESIYLNYVTSQIQKARNRATAQNQKVEQKKIRLLYIFNQDEDLNNDIAITHFTKYNQQFDDGRLDQMKNISKRQLFNNVITIDSLFIYVHQAFDFTFQGTQNTLKAQQIFAKLAHQLYQKKDGLLCKQAQDMALFLEPNLEMSEQVIKQMLLDQQITRKYKNYREALTKYFADRKLLGALAVFLRYLFEKESFMSYSNEQLLEYQRDVQNCHFDREIQTMIIETKSKSNNSYYQLMHDLMQSKKQFIANDYRTLKMTKRLPTMQRKFAVKILKPRLLSFSKAQCEAILNYGEKEIGWYVKQIYSYDENEEKDKFQSAMKTYEDQFKKKTRFSINGGQKNLYNTYINEDKALKTLLMLDLLSDFCDQKGLSLKYLGRYYKIISRFFGVEQKKNVKSDRTLTFSKMVCILIGYEDIWVQIFKICQTLCDEGHELNINRNEEPATRNSIKMYVDGLYKYLQGLLLGANIMTTFKNPEKYTSIYINTIFHLQKLEQLINLSIPNKLKSTRTTLVFIQMFDVNNKVRHIGEFMKFKSKLQTSSHYQDMYNYFQALKQQASKEQRQKITQFKANRLFYEWFTIQPENKECLRLFLQNCNNQTFVHNSVATINLFISTSSHNKYNNIEETFKKLSNQKQPEISSLLKALGEQAKAKNYKNNLAILITNIFIQNLTTNFKNQRLIVNNDKKFVNILDKIVNSGASGIGTLFAFAYFKIYLKEYVGRLINQQKSVAMSEINEILERDNAQCKNLRFYCLKLMRTLMPIKEIKEKYIKVRTVLWMEDLKDLFEEEQSRSISVPNQLGINATPTFIEKINLIIASHGGEFNLIDQLVQEANTPYNRYALFNFFMRYYFSMSYNEKLHKNGIRQKLLASRAKYSEKLGKLQFQLILRYAQSRFDQNLKVDNAAQFKEDLFVNFNSLNWLLASKSSTSPFHSIFFNKGQFHADFKASFQNIFFPCGPENDYIRMAQNVYALTRNNNIGVYLCSAQCDYIYSHEDCGWPREQATCPVCKKAIGCKPGQSHTVNRQQQGARRINSPTFKDKGSKFYVYYMTALTNYWQMQRNYIQAEINRMKKTSVVKLGDYITKITGYNVENNGRVSTLSYYYFRQNLNSIFYCLLSLGVFSEQQCAGIFNGKNIASAKKLFWQENKSDIDNIKKALNLDNKFYGWIFGMHKNMYKTLINFQSQFTNYIASIKESSIELAGRLQQEINEKKIHADYFELYKDMSVALRNGLLTKQLETTFDMTAANRYTRDFLQSKVQSFIKTFTTMEKFAFAQENASLQGKMQFPRDILLTQDEIDEEQFKYSRILKIPDKEIRYNEIIINYELNIRQNYPFLDYILKNSDLISSMYDFYNVLTFANELAKQIEYNYERKDANKSLREFTTELWVKKQEKMHQILRNPQIVTVSWNKLANRMGTLQNDCTVVGKMNNDYNVDAPIQAFLLDNSTKENLFGLTLSSLFHNFAKMHNQLVVLLNARKNQIPQFKCLNLYNESKKVHPQKLQQTDVFMITQKELEEQLYQNSISSINYGKNFIFNNFDSYQQYFLMKLLGKCELISEIKKFKSICYNGEAFAQTSESSNTLTQVRDYFYEELTREEVREVQGIIRKQGNKQKIEEYVVKLRGDLEKTMIAIRNLNGIIQSKCLGDFIQKLGFDEVTYELRQQTFGKLQVSKIVNFYQLLELQLKPTIIEKLPIRYKEIMDEQTQREIRNLLQQLPLQDQYRVTLTQFGYALYRFIARILQGGVQQNDKILMEFLPFRNDFWPKGFEQYKLEVLMNNQKMNTLIFAYAGHLFEIAEQQIKRKIGVSRI